MPDFYRILQVPPRASQSDIKLSYKLLAKQFHPDSSPLDRALAEEKFKEVSEAFAVLGDPELRRDYDEFLHGFEDAGREVTEKELKERWAGPAGHYLKCLAWGTLFVLVSLAPSLQARGLTEKQRCALVLDRLSWGPAPGDLEKLRRTGIEAYLREQMDPASLDDHACREALSGMEIYRKSPAELHQASQESRARDKGAMMEEDMAVKNGLIFSQREILKQLTEAKLTRLVTSRRQLEEVMVDFWFNHFNVSWQKNACKWLVPAYEEEAIRPYALGKFRDLLGAVAKSPAMLVYLDNAYSMADERYMPESQRPQMKKVAARMAGNKKVAPKGLNENYARELMELHTLGVDGGYDQKDVIEAARVLTGWSLLGPGPKVKVTRWDHGPDGAVLDPTQARPLTFVFRSLLHDKGSKVVLGRKFPEKGMAEGEALLDLLSRHPATARFIATKLCRRFVADEPPPALVARVAREFLATDGDIRRCLVLIFHSPEFFSPEAYRAKFKTPLEFTVSALRATGARMLSPARVGRRLYAMGQPLYLCEPPTGYADTAAAWVSSGGLLDRMNFAVQILKPENEFAEVDRDRFQGTALALGSPEFQRK